MNTKPDRKFIAIGFGVFLISLLIRLIGVQWGLPNSDRWHSFHPDEEVVLAYSQLIQPAKGQFTPGFYNYGTLFLTVEKIVTDVVNGYGGGPVEKDGSDVPQAIGRYILGGRILNCLAGALAALAVFLAVSRHTHWIGGVMGGLAIGLTPGLVVHSRFLTVDVMATCFLAWSLYFCTKMFPAQDGEPVADKDILKASIWAGVFAGLSAGTKYTGILAVVAIGFTAWFVIPRSEFGKFAKVKALGVLTAFVTFLIVTPGILLDNAKFMEDFKYEMAHTSAGHGLVFAGSSPGWIFHFSNLIVGYGGLLLALSLFGLGRGLWRKQLWLIGPVVFLVLIYILIGRAEVKFLRYTFPLIPVLAMGFGWLMGQAHVVRTNRARMLVALGIFALGGFGGGLMSTASLTRWMAGPDVRDEMAVFIREHLPKGSTIGIVSDPWYYTPTFHPNAQAGPAQSHARDRISDRLEQLAQVPDFDIVRYTPLDISQRRDWDIRLLTEVNPDFVIFSSFEVEGLVRLYEQKLDDAKFAAQLAQYTEFQNELQAKYEILTVTDQNGMKVPVLGLDALGTTSGIHDMAYVRPQLWIWIKKNSSVTESNGSSTRSNSSEGQADTPSKPTQETSPEPPSTSPNEGETTGTN